MTTGQVIWELLVGGSLLVLVLAVFIKIRGPSNWSLGGFITGLKQSIQLKPSPGKPVASTDGPL